MQTGYVPSQFLSHAQQPEHYLPKVGEWASCAVDFWYGRLAHGCK